MAIILLAIPAILLAFSYYVSLHCYSKLCNYSGLVLVDSSYIPFQSFISLLICEISCIILVPLGVRILEGDTLFSTDIITAMVYSAIIFSIWALLNNVAFSQITSKCTNIIVLLSTTFDKVSTVIQLKKPTCIIKKTDSIIVLNNNCRTYVANIIASEKSSAQSDYALIILLLLVFFLVFIPLLAR